MGRNILRLDVRGIEETINQLNRVAKEDSKKATEDALTKAGKKIGDDTIRGLDKAYLPAGGKYSHGKTRESVMQNPSVEWKGESASIGVGFDFGKKGAGGYLITGTPKMKPDKPLHRIYKEKSYMNEIEKDMQKTIGEYIGKALTR